MKNLGEKQMKKTIWADTCSYSCFSIRRKSIYNKLTKPNFFSPKTTKALSARLSDSLEEQIAIKEKHSGIEIEFSPIYVTGDDDSSMLKLMYIRQFMINMESSYFGYKNMSQIVLVLLLT